MKLRTLLILTISLYSALGVLSACSGERDFDVSIDDGYGFFPADTIVKWDGSDTMIVDRYISCYEVHVSKYYDGERFYEIGKVLTVDEIEDKTCALQDIVNKKIESYKELRDLEEKLEEKDC